MLESSLPELTGDDVRLLSAIVAVLCKIVSLLICESMSIVGW